MTVISNGKYDFDTVLELRMDQLILLYNKIMEMAMISGMGLGMGGMSTGKQTEKPKHWEETLGNGHRVEHNVYSIQDLFDNPDVVKM